MLNVKKLKEMLERNKVLSEQALKDETPHGAKRLNELMLHRSILKDSLIEALESELNHAPKKVA